MVKMDIMSFIIHRRDEGVGLGLSRNLSLDNKVLSDLHPYVQTLSVSNLDSCVALENATFAEEERCSREKVNRQHLFGHSFSAGCCMASIKTIESFTLG